MSSGVSDEGSKGDEEELLRTTSAPIQESLRREEGSGWMVKRGDVERVIDGILHELK